MSADKKRPGLGIKMTSYDELCGGDIGLDNSVEINIEELHDFPDHPFRVKDDEQMDELVKSISLRGIINAIIVRKDPAGGYQIISGHRRTHAARKPSATVRSNAANPPARMTAWMNQNVSSSSQHWCWLRLLPPH